MAEKDKIELTSKGLENILNKSMKNFQEERDLALERYRREDEEIVTKEDFVLLGKDTVDYLKTAAGRSDAMFNIAKLLKDLVISSNNNGGGDNSGVGKGSIGLDDAAKKQIQEFLKDAEES